ncbi:VOC family protein [Lentilactobacillus sp. SPB1-3]|uniref:VOC family protein n=1 Tax=Lentilactobacillus terminaliae TaxID=3003483 RepID=A0ACD5DHR8_9LACO|nr:VOC family protein [Lentilactobacillus sp. SPB1-3]MCZ0976963.1 VOC family protein [Lentilactobacillus sp. SPB1-3]
MHSHHISLLTKDAKQNIDFYTRVMGLRLIKNTVNQENIKIRHLFYGDYLGTPGSVVTFFALPLLGQRTDAKHFFNGFRLAIPTGSAEFWQKRLSAENLVVKEIPDGLAFNDPEGIEIELVVTDRKLVGYQVVPDNGIPAEFQVSRLLGTELHIPDPDKTASFFHDWLGLVITGDNEVQLEDNESIRLFATDSDDRTRFGRGSIDHFALAVADTDELEKYYQIAKEQHLNIEEYIDRGWFKSLYVRDPGDNRIELATLGPGFSLDEPILTMGSTLGLPPAFEGNRQEIMDYYAKTGVNFADKN